MTPADRIREVLDAHGVDPDTVSLSGPRTLLGGELERAMRAIIGDARWSQVDAIRDGLIDRVRAAEARHRRHLARLRWRREHKGDKPLADVDRLFRRQRVYRHPELSTFRCSTIRHGPIAGPPGDSKRPAGVLP